MKRKAEGYSHASDTGAPRSKHARRETKSGDQKTVSTARPSQFPNELDDRRRFELMQTVTLEQFNRSPTELPENTQRTALPIAAFRKNRGIFAVSQRSAPIAAFPAASSSSSAVVDSTKMPAFAFDLQLSLYTREKFLHNVSQTIQFQCDTANTELLAKELGPKLDILRKDVERRDQKNQIADGKALLFEHSRSVEHAFAPYLTAGLWTAGSLMNGAAGALDPSKWHIPSKEELAPLNHVKMEEKLLELSEARQLQCIKDRISAQQLVRTPYKLMSEQEFEQKVTPKANRSSAGATPPLDQVIWQKQRRLRWHYDTLQQHLTAMNLLVVELDWAMELMYRDYNSRGLKKWSEIVDRGLSSEPRVLGRAPAGLPPTYLENARQETLAEEMGVNEEDHTNESRVGAINAYLSDCNTYIELERALRTLLIPSSIASAQQHDRIQRLCDRATRSGVFHLKPLENRLHTQCSTEAPPISATDVICSPHAGATNRSLAILRGAADRKFTAVSVLDAAVWNQPGVVFEQAVSKELDEYVSREPNSGADAEDYFEVCTRCMAIASSSVHYSVRVKALEAAESALIDLTAFAKQEREDPGRLFPQNETGIFFTRALLVMMQQGAALSNLTHEIAGQDSNKKLRRWLLYFWAIDELVNFTTKAIAAYTAEHGEEHLKDEFLMGAFSVVRLVLASDLPRKLHDLPPSEWGFAGASEARKEGRPAFIHSKWAYDHKTAYPVAKDKFEADTPWLRKLNDFVSEQSDLSQLLQSRKSAQESLVPFERQFDRNTGKDMKWGGLVDEEFRAPAANDPSHAFMTHPLRAWLDGKLTEAWLTIPSLIRKDQTFAAWRAESDPGPFVHEYASRCSDLLIQLRAAASMHFAAIASETLPVHPTVCRDEYAYCDSPRTSNGLLFYHYNKVPSNFVLLPFRDELPKDRRSGSWVEQWPCATLDGFPALDANLFDAIDSSRKKAADLSKSYLPSTLADVDKPTLFAGMPVLISFPETTASAAVRRYAVVKRIHREILSGNQQQIEFTPLGESAEEKAALPPILEWSAGTTVCVLAKSTSRREYNILYPPLQSLGKFTYLSVYDFAWYPGRLTLAASGATSTAAAAAAAAAAPRPAAKESKDSKRDPKGTRVAGQGQSSAFLPETDDFEKSENYSLAQMSSSQLRSLDEPEPTDTVMALEPEPSRPARPALAPSLSKRSSDDEPTAMDESTDANEGETKATAEADDDDQLAELLDANANASVGASSSQDGQVQSQFAQMDEDEETPTAEVVPSTAADNDPGDVKASIADIDGDASMPQVKTEPGQDEKQFSTAAAVAAPPPPPSPQQSKQADKFKTMQPEQRIDYALKQLYRSFMTEMKERVFGSAAEKRAYAEQAFNRILSKAAVHEHLSMQERKRLAAELDSRRNNFINRAAPAERKDAEGDTEMKADDAAASRNPRQSSAPPPQPGKQPESKADAKDSSSAQSKPSGAATPPAVQPNNYQNLGREKMPIVFSPTPVYVPKTGKSVTTLYQLQHSACERGNSPVQLKPLWERAPQSLQFLVPPKAKYEHRAVKPHEPGIPSALTFTDLATAESMSKDDIFLPIGGHIIPRLLTRLPDTNVDLYNAIDTNRPPAALPINPFLSLSLSSLRGALRKQLNKFELGKEGPKRQWQILKLAPVVRETSSNSSSSGGSGTRQIFAGSGLSDESERNLLKLGMEEFNIAALPNASALTLEPNVHTAFGAGGVYVPGPGFAAVFADTERKGDEKSDQTVADFASLGNSEKDRMMPNVNCDIVRLVVSRLGDPISRQPITSPLPEKGDSDKALVYPVPRLFLRLKSAAKTPGDMLIVADLSKFKRDVVSPFAVYRRYTTRVPGLDPQRQSMFEGANLFAPFAIRPRPGMVIDKGTAITMSSSLDEGGKLTTAIVERLMGIEMAFTDLKRSSQNQTTREQIATHVDNRLRNGESIEMFPNMDEKWSDLVRTVLSLDKEYHRLWAMKHSLFDVATTYSVPDTDIICSLALDAVLERLALDYCCVFLAGEKDRERQLAVSKGKTPARYTAVFTPENSVNAVSVTVAIPQSNSKSLNTYRLTRVLRRLDHNHELRIVQLLSRDEDGTLSIVKVDSVDKARKLLEEAQRRHDLYAHARAWPGYSDAPRAPDEKSHGDKNVLPHPVDVIPNDAPLTYYLIGGTKELVTHKDIYRMSSMLSKQRSVSEPANDAPAWMKHHPRSAVESLNKNFNPPPAKPKPAAAKPKKKKSNLLNES